MTKQRQYKHPQFNLRIPEDLKEAIEIAAKSNGRSMNAEIVARLEQSFYMGAWSEEQDPYLAMLGMIKQLGTLAALMPPELLRLGIESGRVKVDEKNREESDDG